MPGCLMALGRMNRPGLMIYGGTIKPGFTHFGGDDQKTRRGKRLPVLR